MKRTKITEDQAERAAEILQEHDEIFEAMHETVWDVLEDQGVDPQEVPQKEFYMLMVHAVASVLKQKDDVASEWVSEDELERLFQEEMPKLADPKTGIVREDDLIEAVTWRQEQILHKHAPKLFPEAPSKERPKKKGTGPPMKQFQDFTIEEAERLGPEMSPLVHMARLVNPDVTEAKLRKMTVREAFAEEEEDS